MFLLADITEKLGDIFKDWYQAISDPLHKLSISAPPSEHISEGITLFVSLAVLTAILSAPIALQQKGSAGEKAGTTFNAVFALIVGAIITAAWHFAFKLLGGKADFAGSYLAYCYGYAPYMPLITFASLVTATGIPRKYHPLLLNPGTAGQAVQLAWKDPEASNFAIGLGGILTWVVIIQATIVGFRALRFEHDVHGWHYAVAVIISLIVGIPIGSILTRMATMFVPLPDINALQQNPPTANDAG